MIAVRGTMSLADCITDLVAAPVPLPDADSFSSGAARTGADAKPWHVHQVSGTVHVHLYAAGRRRLTTRVPQGMWVGARAIAAELRAQRTLERLLGPGAYFADCMAERDDAETEKPSSPSVPGYDLVLCGHSLGAGVASLLAILLRQVCARSAPQFAMRCLHPLHCCSRRAATAIPQAALLRLRASVSHVRKHGRQLPTIRHVCDAGRGLGAAPVPGDD